MLHIDNIRIRHFTEQKMCHHQDEQSKEHLHMRGEDIVPHGKM